MDFKKGEYLIVRYNGVEKIAQFGAVYDGKSRPLPLVTFPGIGGWNPECLPPRFLIAWEDIIFRFGDTEMGNILYGN